MSRKAPFSFLQNWISMVGILGAGVVLALGFGLLLIDILLGHAHPYFGLIVYVAVPVLLIGCLFLAVLGALWTAWRSARGLARAPAKTQTVWNPILIRRVAVVLVLFALLGVFGAVVAYRAYHFTESVEFCGLLCHAVMKPEYNSHHNSPHANVGCSECHIGPGAKWFVKAKVSGLYQVYSVLFNKYHRPIATPLENLRPARDTCHACHWPEKFFGGVMRQWTYYLPDRKNTPWTIKMLMHTGGGDPSHGPVQGIHWHMEGVNDVEYIATDEKRMEIPWVRVTDQDGNETVYQTTEKKKRLTDEQAQTLERRRMDCLDCHNRPTHNYLSPNDAMDLALFSGRLNPELPSIKATGAKLLAGDYATEDEGLAAIAEGLAKKYPDLPELAETTQVLQSVFSANVFPEMKVRWDAYPDHIGHKITPGCFRCHDGNHVSESGKAIRKDCQICHTILAQGTGEDLDTMSAKGLEFEHPEDIGDMWMEERCDSCHTGAP